MPVPPRGGARPRQLHPRREGLHDVHPGVPAVPRRGSRRPTCTCSGGCASPTRWPGIWRQLLLTRAADDDAARARPGRRVRVGDARSGCSSTTTSRRRWCRASSPTTPGRPSRCWSAPATRCWPPPAAATRTAPTRWPCARPRSEGLSRLALVGMGCQTSSPPIDVGPQGGQGVQAVPVQHRPAVLEDVRRRHLPRAVRGQVRPGQVRDGEDEHQGRVPDLDAATARTTRSTSRSATSGRGEGCKHCPDFAAEHADISTGGIGKDNDWTLTIVRTELGEEVIEPDDRRRHDRRPPGPGGRGGDEAAAHPVDRVPPALARGRRPCARRRRAAAQEEGAAPRRHRRRPERRRISPPWSPTASSARSRRPLSSWRRSRPTVPSTSGVSAVPVASVRHAVRSATISWYSGVPLAASSSGVV